MKIRFDFVSNSSSSSYVISCKAEYVDRFIKDLARACICKNDEWHDPNLAKRNERILNFCFNSFELLFLGRLVTDVEWIRYDLDFFKERYKKQYKDLKIDDDENKSLDDSAKKDFENYKRRIKDIKCGKAEPWQIENFGKDKKILGEDAYWHCAEKDIGRIAIDRESSQYELKHYHFKDDNGNEIPDKKDVIDARVKKIVDIARSKINAEWKNRTLSTIDTYEITLDTIANTRELIDAGYAIKFDKAEDLDLLEKRMKDGHRIFYLRIAYSGDGYGTFYIYKEDGSEGLSEKLPIEIISCGD